MENLTPISVCLEEFKSSGEFDRFDKWVKFRHRRRIWTDELRWHSILWVIITKELSSVSKITHKDLAKFQQTHAYTPYNTYKDMIIEMAMEKSIDLGSKQPYIYSKPFSTEEKERMLTNTVEYVPTDSEVMLMEGVQSTQLKDVPLIISKLANKNTMFECEIDQGDLASFLGVVYIIYLKSTNDIVYVGSTDELHDRKLSHSNSSRSLKSKQPLYEFVRNNGLNFDEDFSFMVVSTCVAGFSFETFIEDAFYVEMYKNRRFPRVLNGDKRPNCSKLFDDGWIYAVRDSSTEGSPAKYVGQSVNALKRFMDHKRDAYRNSKQLSKPLYEAARSLNPQSWPANLTFDVIEKCPVWMMNKREMHWIHEMNTIRPRGFNVDVYVSSEQLQCQYCLESFANFQGAKRHISLCAANLNAKPEKFKCDDCGREYSRKESLEKHRQICSKEPKKEGKFPCKLCDTKLNTKNNLKRHMKNCPKNPTPTEKEWECDFCDKTFHEKHNMISHRNRCTKNTSNTSQ